MNQKLYAIKTGKQDKKLLKKINMNKYYTRNRGKRDLSFINKQNY